RAAYVEHVVDHCLRNVADLAVLTGTPESTLRRGLQELDPRGRPWETVWRRQGVTYRAPADLIALRQPSESVDLVFSLDCLNYIPLAQLRATFAATARMLRPGGATAHNIAVYDDFTIHDSTIPPWNFLRYDEGTWQRIGNTRSHHQNRLRPFQYEALATQQGLSVVYAARLPFCPEPRIDRGTLQPNLRRLAAEEIACRHFLFAARKPSGSRGARPDLAS